MVTVALPPFPIVPRLHVSVFPASGSQLPWLGVIVPTVKLDGMMSVTITLVASSGPAFDTVSV